MLSIEKKKINKRQSRIFYFDNKKYVFPSLKTTEKIEKKCTVFTVVLIEVLTFFFSIQINFSKNVY